MTGAEPGVMTGREYSRLYNHNSHLTDGAGVIRSDCIGCQRHLREAFGPTIADVISAYQASQAGSLHLTDTEWADADFLIARAESRLAEDDIPTAITLLILALEADTKAGT